MLSRVIEIALEVLDIAVIASLLYFLAWVIAAVLNTLEDKYGQGLSLLIFSCLCVALVVLSFFVI